MLQQAVPGFRHELARHYQERGYQVHEERKVRGRSGAVYAIGMVVQAPFGNMVIQFDDDGELGPAEVSAIRSAGKDIGATPVIACRTIEGMVRHAATRLGVAVVDESTLAEEAIKAPEMSDPTEEWAPWPGAETEPEPAWPEQRDEEPPARPGIAKEHLDAQFRTRRRDTGDRFGWLNPGKAHTPAPPHPQSPAPATTEPRPTEPATDAPQPRVLVDEQQETVQVQAPLPRSVRKPARPTWWPALVAGTAAGVVGGLLFFLLAMLLL